MSTQRLKIDTTSSIGFLIGISAWSITFVTLIWGYLFYRLKTGEWLASYIDTPVIAKAVVNTAILLASSALLHHYRTKKNKLSLFSGLIAGAFFLNVQWHLWMVFAQAGLNIKDSLAGSFLYLLTGFHALHVLIGLVIILAFGVILQKTAGTDRDEYHFLFALRFWDLLAVFWIVLLVLIFFIQ